MNKTVQQMPLIKVRTSLIVSILFIGMGPRRTQIIAQLFKCRVRDDIRHEKAREVRQGKTRSDSNAQSLSIGRMISASLKEELVGSTLPPSSIAQIADKTACANPQASDRSKSSLSLSVNRLSRLSMVKRERNRSGRSFGLRSTAPISYSTSPITPLGSIATQPRSESNRTL